MSKTGNIFIDVFSFIIIFLPLLPVSIIIIQKKYKEETLIFLMILCLLYFIQNILLGIPQFTLNNQNIIINLFSVIELMIMLLLFKLTLPPKLKHLINFFMISFLATVITFYSLKGLNERRMGIEIIQNAAIIIVIIVVLFELISDDSLFTFNHPAFLIATGSLFYFTVAVIINISGTNDTTSQTDIGPEKIILSNTANLIRFILFALAVLFYRDINAEKKLWED